MPLAGSALLKLNEIIPALRKHGFYALPASDPRSLLTPTLLRQIADRIENLETKVAELQPKADYCDKILQSKGGIPITVIAKEYGYSGKAFNELLRSYKIQYKVGNTWVLNQKYAGKGYTETRTVTLREGFSPTVQMLWTQKGRNFLYNELKRHGILPLCEREVPMATLL